MARSASAPAERRSVVVLLAFVAVCLGVSSIGAAITYSSIDTWYPSLDKPAFTPPDWLFAPVWTTLYLMMAVAAWRIWSHGDRREVNVALACFGVQLTLNLLWTVLFFGLRSPGAALMEIVVLLLAIAVTAATFFRVDRVAGLLFVPYLAWTAFAADLGLEILAAQLTGDHIREIARTPPDPSPIEGRSPPMDDRVHRSAAVNGYHLRPAGRGRRSRRAGVTAATALIAGLAAMSACSPIGSLNALFVSRDGYRVDRGLAYGTNRRQVLDVYVPDDGTRPARVVVFFYGGAWRGGSRNYYRFLGQALTRCGFVVVIPDYRVSPEVRFPAFVEDGAAALRWVHENIAAYGGDADDIWLVGHSAGAHIAALLVTDDRYLAAEGVPPASIRGFVGLAGPYAIDPLKYRSTREAFAGLTSPQVAQPMTYVDGEEPPMLLLHGADDGTVWPVNSHAFAERVNAAGGRAEVVEVPDTGHIGILLSLSQVLRGSGDVFGRTVRFLAAETDRAAEGDTAAAATPPWSCARADNPL